MPLNISNDTPRNDRTIGGVLVKVPAPYAAGHVVTEGEAAMLNQTLAENFSNNLRDKVGKFVPEGAAEGTEPRTATTDEAQALVDAYASTYEPGVRRSGGGGGSRTLDPVEKEMKAIASEAVNNLLKSQNVKRKDVDFAALVSQVLEEHGDGIRAKAEKVVKERAKTNDSLDLSSLLGAGASE